MVWFRRFPVGMGRLLEVVCTECHVRLGASPVEKNLLIVEQLHQCPAEVVWQPGPPERRRSARPDGRERRRNERPDGHERRRL
ncbi:MAG TPA: hypothetical protein VFA60_15705 [Terriglobales bacterium]|nr:hypothetical protein [Terriglobales bacterium]